jgi:glycosyltransferase involved in cell wall biosynthesis
LLVWIFQSGEPLHCDSNNPRAMRAMNLADAMTKAGHSVVVWSAAFDHLRKEHRADHFKKININEGLQINLIPSVGYSKNISFKRLFDHAQMAYRLKKALKDHASDYPDVAFIGYPPIEFAYVAGRWCHKKKIPFVLDVKDQWPDIFLRGLPDALIPIAKTFFSPYFFMGRWLGKNAKSACSMTVEFLNWFISFSGRKKSSNDFVFPLAPIIKRIDPEDMAISINWVATLGLKKCPKDKIILFVGNFMRTAYDFLPIIEAANLSRQANFSWKFVLCGDGEEWLAIKELAKDMPNVIMPGRVSRYQLEAMAEIADIGLAPINSSPDYLLSVPNKIVDYFSLGLPVLTSLDGVASKLIKRWNVGSNYSAKDPEQLFILLEKYFNNQFLINTQKINSKKLFENEFNGEYIYQNSVKKIEGLI